MVMENQFASESKMQQEIDKAKKKIKLTNPSLGNPYLLLHIIFYINMIRWQVRSKV